MYQINKNYFHRSNFAPAYDMHTLDRSITMSHQKCLRNLDHEWETVSETETHILKQCERCNVKNWKYRNKGIRRNLNQRIPARTCI